jgi:hypothetical protein
MGNRSPGRWLLWLSLLTLLLPREVAAFCGFFVSGADGPLVNDATQVALMRDGTRTVLSMSNSYRGPLSDFALVIPVPVILQKENVRTLPTTLFGQLSQLTGPRLVEYWERDPCFQEVYEEEKSTDNKEGGTGTRAKGEEGAMGQRPLVRVEAEFSVDEYEIVILSAEDSTALELWLRQNSYKIPQGVEPFLRPYVVNGSKFFVARVNAAKVKFSLGRAVLSPLRFHYDSEKFELPIRLGLANADGPQDLLIYLLDPAGHRVEVANYDNVFVPTNLEVKAEVRDLFPSFYASLFDRTVASKPRAVVTEYAWSAASCDPCPTPPLDQETLDRLGRDVLPRKNLSAFDFTLTRLHARYSKDTLGDDLVFRTASPVEGGRAGMSKNTQDAVPAGSNAFQARYILRHPWSGPITCDDPDFGSWGERPEGVEPPPPVRQDTSVRRDLPVDALVHPRPLTAEDRLSPFERFYYAVRRLALRLFKSPVPPILAFFAAVLVLALQSHRWKVSSRYLLAFVALALLPLSFAVDALIPRSTRVPVAWLFSVRTSLEEAGFSRLFFAVYLGAAALGMLHGAARAAGRSVPPWRSLLVGLLPLFLGVGIFHRNLQQTAAVILDPSVGWGSRGSILAQGEAESLQALVLGGAASALLLAVMAAGLVGKGAAVAPAGLRGRILGAGIAGLAVSAGLVLLGARGLAWEGLRWHRHDREGWPLLVSLLLLLGTLGVALRAARRWPAEEERGAFLDRCATAALFLGLAGLFAAWSGALHVHLSRLEWLYAERPPLSLVEKIEKFTALGRGGVALALGSPMLVILQLLPLLLLLRGVRREHREARPEEAMAAARAALSALLSLGILAGWLYARHNAQHQLPHVEGDERLRVGSFQLPETQTFAREVLRTSRKPKGAAFLVDREGKLRGSSAARHPLRPFDDALFREIARGGDDLEAPAEPVLAVDAGLTFAALEEALTPLRERRQTSFRWLVGVELPQEHDGLIRGLGRFEDVFGWVRLRAPIPVEWLPRIEVSEGGKEQPRRVLAVKPMIGGKIATWWMTGGLGVYQRRKEASVTSFRRLVPGPTGEPGNEGEYSGALAAEVFAVDEILVVVPPKMTARELSELMLELRWYGEVLVPRLRSRRMGSGPRRAAPLTFALTGAPDLP